MPAAAVHADEQAFQQALDANPADSGVRLVFADWLDERGDERAAGYRAMGELGKYPELNAGWNGGYWQFYDEVQHPRGPHDTGLRSGPNFLPHVWSTALNRRPMGQKHSHATRRGLEDNAALAFARLTPEQQAAARGFPGSPDERDTTPPRR